MEWFDSPAAMTLLQREQTLLSSYLPTLFGYHMLQLGQLFTDQAFQSSPIKHRFSMSLGSLQPAAGLAGLAEAWPFERESLDLVVMPHVLEFSSSPHSILREVDRCLIPEGHVLIFGFNPWSHWQLVRGVLRWRQPVPWRGHYISQGRLGDWLKLLGFEVVDSQT
jgi:SAM-dependent methyltransferase